MRSKIKIIPFVLILTILVLPSCNELQQIMKEGSEKLNVNGDKPLSETEIIAGLKEALTTGTKNTVKTLSATNGFYKDPSAFIPFPEEAVKVKEIAIKYGLEQQVTQFEETLNRAAEKASEEAYDIFASAITSMSVQDAWGILKGNDDAATQYLISTTSKKLHDKFYPVVANATEEVMLTKYWNPLIDKYNKTSVIHGGENIDTDLNEYVTQRALKGIYAKIAIEESKIRKDPVSRVTDLLKKVFGSLDQ